MTTPSSAKPNIALGTDIVEVARIADLVQRHADHFTNRIFTQQELEYANANPKRMHEHLAARFAAKEAALKALGTGLTQGIHWTDIEVTRDNAGKPSLSITNQAKTIAEEQSLTRFELSISHTTAYATATVIAW